jgi:hypothetical protein
MSIADTDLNTLTDVYLRHHSQKEQADFWAWLEVERRVRTSLHRGWEVTLLLLKKAKTDAALGYVAAGPLEDLIDGYGNAAFDLVELEFDRDSRLQLALSGIWIDYNSPEFERWSALMMKYGFTEGRARL